MTDRTILALVVLVVGVPIAFVMDRNSWRKRPREDLERILRERDWARMTTALKEIKRRGEDISPYIPCALALLLSESSPVRSAGKLTIKDHYPEIARQITKFEATGKAEAREAILAPLLEKYGVQKDS